MESSAGAERGMLNRAAIRTGRARNFQCDISNVLLPALDKTESDRLHEKCAGGRRALSGARAFAVGTITLALTLPDASAYAEEIRVLCAVLGPQGFRQLLINCLRTN